MFDKMKIRIHVLFAVCCLALCGCNEPPLYHSKAEEFLNNEGVPSDLIQRLQSQRPLSEEEATQLQAFRNIPTLHLLASNPTTPQNILVDLSKHSSFEVHTGLVSNPSTPLDVVLGFRDKGRYTTVNDYMARNPNLPPEILIEMFNAGETGLVSPALNPNCPPEIMWKIFNRNDRIANVWLATNPNLPEELVVRLAELDDSLIMQRLRSNPVYRRVNDTNRIG
jgi:hypothetical protein